MRNYFKYFIVLCLFFSNLNIVQAQFNADSLPSNQKHFNRIHFGFEINSGVTQAQVYRKQGNASLKPNKSIVAVHDLGIVLNKNISETWSANVKFGFGYFPVELRFPNEEYYLFKYWDNLIGKSYLSAQAEAEYRFGKNYNRQKYVSAGVSILYFDDGRTEVGNETKMNGHTVQSDYLFYVPNRYNVLFHASIGKQIILKDLNIFSIYIKASYSAQRIFTGNYFAKDLTTSQTSGGNFFYSGNSIGLGIRYTFSGIKKTILSDKIKTENPLLTKSELKKIYRQKIMEENSHGFLRIGFNAGPTLQVSKLDNKHSLFANGYAITFAANVSVSYVVNNSTFVEAAIGFASYNMTQRPNVQPLNCLICGTTSDAFVTEQVSVGAAKEIVLKNNIRLLTFHAGVAAAYVPGDKGMVSTGSSYFVDGTDTLINEHHTDYQLKKFSPLLYAGISKQFIINNKLDFAIGYFYYVGLRNLYRSDVTYTSSQSNGTNTTSYFINGTYQHLQLGFIYKIDKRNPKQN